MATRSSPFRPGSRAVREHDRHLRHRERLRDAGPCAVRQVDQHALGVACGHERAAEIAQAAVRGRLGLEVADEAIKVVSKTSVEGYAGFQRLGSAISCRSPFAATGGFRLTAAGRPPPSNVSCCPELPLAASVNRSRLHFGSRRSIECPLARAANWRSRPNGPRRDYFGRMPAPLASCRSLSSSQNRCSATVVIRKSLRQPGRRTAAFKARDLALTTRSGHPTADIHVRRAVIAWCGRCRSLRTTAANCCIDSSGPVTWCSRPTVASSMPAAAAEARRTT